MGVLAIGVACIDTTIEIDQPLMENRKYSCTGTTLSGGGPAFNAACLCALWQADAYLLSRIGTDENGRHIEAIAKQSKLKLLGCVDERFSTAHSYIVSCNVNGSRTVLNYPCHQTLNDFTFQPLPIKVILSDGHLPALTLKAQKYYADAQLIVDADICNENTIQAAKAADFIICSEEFASDYLGEALALHDRTALNQQFETIRELNHRQLIITIGDRGAIYKIGDQPEIFPAYPVKAVDSCGAGDIFHGAFAWCVDQQASMLDALKIASLTASISVTRKGSQTSIPSYDEVMAKFRQS